MLFRSGKHAIVHEDGRITSDGTTVLGADDVSALASYIEAIRTIQEQNISHGDIELAISVAEEPYDAGSAYYDFGRIQSRIGYTFDLAGEVGLAAIEAPSIVSFKIVVEGKSAHAGFNPEDGIHALARRRPVERQNATKSACFCSLKCRSRETSFLLRLISFRQRLAVFMSSSPVRYPYSFARALTSSFCVYGDNDLRVFIHSCIYG